MLFAIDDVVHIFMPNCKLQFECSFML